MTSWPAIERCMRRQGDTSARWRFAEESAGQHAPHEMVMVIPANDPDVIFTPNLGLWNGARHVPVLMLKDDD